jgi:hypothetical protein
MSNTCNLHTEDEQEDESGDGVSFPNYHHTEVEKEKDDLAVRSTLTLSIRRVTIVPFGNKALYWLSGTKHLPAANRKAVYIHVTRAGICISERFFSPTAPTRPVKGGRGAILHHRFSTCI